MCPEDSADAPPPTHVVAAVLEDLRGRVLLTRRTANRDFAGLWEFPGGKVEPGESPSEALKRELHEELGIEIGPTVPLISVPCAVPTKRGDLAPVARKRLILDVHHTTTWTGRPHGREGQATIWVPRDRLHRYAMPPADRPVVAALSLPPLMLVTPEPDPGNPAAFVDAVLEAVHRATSAQLAVCRAAAKDESHHGTQALLLQLRARTLTTTQRRDLASILLEALPDGVTLVVNSDLEVAQATGTGLHLSAERLAGTPSRPISRTRLLGASCHTAEDLARAETLDCDYAILGPVAPTATHPGARPLGWDAFAVLREPASLPIYAIGGLSPADLPAARAHGAQGIAAIRAFFPSP